MSWIRGAVGKVEQPDPVGADGDPRHADRVLVEVGEVLVTGVGAEVALGGEPVLGDDAVDVFDAGPAAESQCEGWLVVGVDRDRDVGAPFELAMRRAGWCTWGPAIHVAMTTWVPSQWNQVGTMRGSPALVT
jgi:hypothetical protein